MDFIMEFTLTQKAKSPLTISKPKNVLAYLPWFKDLYLIPHFPYICHVYIGPLYCLLSTILIEQVSSIRQIFT